MFQNGELYELGKLSFSDISPLQKTFDDLPPDPYADDRLRSRCYSRYLYHEDQKLELLSSKDFMQKSDINDYVGDVERHYQDIDASLSTDPVFCQMFETFRQKISLHETDIIEAHQIRWHCRENTKNPAPEGNHQDGFDYIAIFMVDTYNVDGGEFMVFEGKNTPPFLKKALKNGEFIILDDRRLFHNAASLIPTKNTEDGHWDVIVLTANKGSKK